MKVVCMVMTACNGNIRRLSSAAATKHRSRVCVEDSWLDGGARTLDDIFNARYKRKQRGYGFNPPSATPDMQRIERQCP